MQLLCILFLYTVAPPVSVLLSSAGTPTLGNPYAFSCYITGIDSLSATVTLEWVDRHGDILKDGDDVLTYLFPAPIELSSAGPYTCRSTITSPFLTSMLTRVDILDINLQSKLNDGLGVFICTSVDMYHIHSIIAECNEHSPSGSKWHL